jgi:hypothetical protein
MNEEFLVGAGHQLAPTTSLPFVHTARRYYRLNGLVRLLEDVAVAVSEIRRTWSFRGSKSRNKVSVGEPAEGSLKRETRVWVRGSLRLSHDIDIRGYRRGVR